MTGRIHVNVFAKCQIPSQGEANYDFQPLLCEIDFHNAVAGVAVTDQLGRLRKAVALYMENNGDFRKLAGDGKWHNARTSLLHGNIELFAVGQRNQQIDNTPMQQLPATIDAVIGPR